MICLLILLCLREVMPRQSLVEKAKRRSTELIRDRQAAVEQMPPKLLEKLGQIEGKLSDIRVQNIRYCYELGKVCLDIAESPEDYRGHDGTAATELLERALATDKRVLRRATQFATEFDEEELERIIYLTDETTDFKLNWGHIMYLLTLDNEEQRWYFAYEAVQYMYDPATLHKVIKNFTQRGQSHGRSHEMPASLAKQVTQMLRLTRQWVTKQREIWAAESVSVFNNLLAANRQQVSADMLTDLYELRDATRDMARESQENIAKLEQIIQHIESLVFTPAEDAAAVTESETPQQPLERGTRRVQAADAAA